MGVDQMANQVGFVQDKEIVKQIDYSKLKTPAIEKIQSGKDENIWRLQQNIFLQVYNKVKQSDITVLPFEVDVQFKAGIKNGPIFSNGQTQLFSLRDVKVNVQMKECQTVENNIQKVFDRLDDIKFEAKRHGGYRVFKRWQDKEKNLLQLQMEETDLTGEESMEL